MDECLKEKCQLLNEFEFVARRLNTPKGFWRIVNKVSESVSLKATTLLQILGVNNHLIQTKDTKRSATILNIGCGDHEPDHCINTELVPTFGGLWRLVRGKNASNVQCYVNILYRDRNLKSVADGIVLSHVLEHLPPHKAIDALRNCLYFLKPGGALRLCVPYLGAYDGCPVPKDQGVSNGILAKNSLIYGWGHRFMYDENILCALLDKAGFIKIKPAAFNEGTLAETDVERRAAESIYVLGYKPGCDGRP